MLAYGQDEVVKTLIHKLTGVHRVEPCTTIAILHNGEFVGGVLYNNYILSPDQKPVSIEMSIATLDKRWASRHNLCGLFHYPFIYLGVKRVQATTSAGAAETQKFLERLGFTLEGIGREAYPLGGDAAVYSMLPHECKWIENDEKFTISSPCT